MTAAQKLTRAIRRSLTAARPAEEKLQERYEQELRHAAREMAARFRTMTITAAATWTPPHVEDVLAVAARESRIQRAQRAMLEAVGAVISDIPGVDFGLTHPVAQSILDKLGARVGAAITDAARTPVAAAIADSWAKGLSVPDTAAAIQSSVYGVAASKATMLARTDLIGMSNAGSSLAANQLNEASRQAGEPVVVETKTWLSSQDDRVRDTHAEADGQTVPIDQPYQVGDALLMYPGDPDGSDEEVINCFPAETLVEMPSLRAATRRWYEGDLIRLRLASGDELAATPNHPILRADGLWTPLCEIREGDYLVSAANLGQPYGAPDPERPPAMIGEIYRLANVASDPQRVGSSPADFHGDGADGQVDVVAVDGSLFADGAAATEEEIAKFGFALTALARLRACGGDVAPLVNGWAERSRLLAAGEIRGDRERSSLPIIQSSHPEKHRLGAATDGQAKLLQKPDDRRAADTYRFGDGEDGFPGSVTLTQVIEIERRPFQGFVYNLDTGVGWYTAASIVCRNCRCVEIYNEDAGDTGDSPGGEDLLASSLLVAVGLSPGWSFPMFDIEVSRDLAAGIRGTRPVPFTRDDEEENVTQLGEAALTMVPVPILVAAAADDESRQRWGSDIAFEGLSTGDGRYMVDGSLAWREPPLTLMAMTETGPGGHEGASVAGRMDAFSKSTAAMDGSKLAKGVTAVYSEGVFDTGERGVEIGRMVGDETLRGVSVDLAINEWGFRDPDTEEILNPDEMTPEEWDRAFMGDLEFAVIDAEIMAATVCPTPAFADARIALLASAVTRYHPQVWTAGPEYAASVGVREGKLMTTLTAALHPVGLTAAGTVTRLHRGIAPLDPPGDWFRRPEASEPTPVTITDDGEFFGHIALWDTCHTGFINGEWSQCITPPRSKTAYARFHLGEIVTAEGEHVSIGKMTVGCGHAPMAASPAQVRDHYDNAGSVGAFVRAQDGVFGVWVCGATRSDMTPEQLRDLRANPPSGDWRSIDHNLELHAALAVPVAGFPVTRSQIALAASADGGVEIVALILTASAIDEPSEQPVVTVSADVLAAMIDGGTDALDALIQAV